MLNDEDIIVRLDFEVKDKVTKLEKHEILRRLIDSGLFPRGGIAVVDNQFAASSGGSKFYVRFENGLPRDQAVAVAKLLVGSYGNLITEPAFFSKDAAS